MTKFISQKFTSKGGKMAFPSVCNRLISDLYHGSTFKKICLTMLQVTYSNYTTLGCACFAGIVQSSFWIHVSHTNGG